MNSTKEEMHVLHSKYAPLWKSWARKLSYVDYDVEDLYQESYILLLKAVEHYDQSKGVPFESYYKIVLYRWRKKYSQRYKAQPVEETVLGDYLDEADEWIDLGEEVIKQERIKRIESILETLSPMESTIIKKFYFEEKKFKEIGEEMGLTVKAVAMRKERILKKLAEIF